MKPLTFRAHMKPITDLKFSNEGDLLFISSKDQSCTVYNIASGEMIGSYQCEGAINQISVNSK